jgi:VanZ like protein
MSSARPTYPPARRRGFPARIATSPSAAGAPWRGVAKTHTPLKCPSVSNGDVKQSASVASPRRTSRIVLVGLVVLVLAAAAFAVRRPLLMSAPTCLAGQWRYCLRTENGVLFMTLAGLPLAGLAVWFLARRRRAAGVALAWRLSLAEVGMVYGTVPFVWMTLMPGSGAGAVPERVSLVPLRDLLTMGPLGIAANLLIFAALGFFAPMRFAALATVPRILTLAATCSTVVETAQYVLQLDRVSSIDDILVNATGAVLAALASHHWWRTTAQVPPDQPRPAPASAT